MDRRADRPLACGSPIPGWRRAEASHETVAAISSFAANDRDEPRREEPADFSQIID
jgi:hypothetical protein